MDVVVSRFDVYLVNLDPTVGHAMRTARPCLVISPDEVNRHISTAIVAPMTSQGRPYPTRVACTFGGKDGQIVLDQLRTVDTLRLVKRLGRLDAPTRRAVLGVLAELFAE